MLRLWTGLQSRFIRDDEGATLVEYALILVFIAVVAIVALNALGDTVRDELNDVASTLGGTTQAP